LIENLERWRRFRLTSLASLPIIWEKAMQSIVVIAFATALTLSFSGGVASAQVLNPKGQVSGQTDFEKIFNRVQTLGLASDDGDRVEFESAWHPDAVLSWTDKRTGKNTRIVGIKNIIKVFDSNMPKPDPQSLHFNSAPVIEIQGDKAVARYRALAPYTTTEPVPLGLNTYRTELVKDSQGEWKVKQQNLTQYSNWKSTPGDNEKYGKD
jgi:hypothetical protein